MPSSRDCLNCGTLLSGRFCHACGQDSALALRPLPELVAEWSDTVLGWETRSGRTLRALLFEPGRLTVEYASGHRASWIHPLRLYLATSVVALAVFGATSDAIATHYAQDFAGVDPRFTQFGATILAISTAMVVLLPLVGAIQALAYRGLGRYYAEHLVFVLHTTSVCYLLQSAASVAQFLLLLLDAPFQALVIVRLCAHAAFAACSFQATRRVYGLGIGETVLRMTIAATLLAPVLFAFVWAMSRGVG